MNDLVNACIVAAKWWSENLGTGKPEYDECYDLRRCPTQPEREMFYSMLADILIDLFQETDVIGLSSNYVPNGILEEVALNCDMGDVIFPNNVTMCISTNKVVVYDKEMKNQKVLYGAKTKSYEIELIY